MKKLSLLALSLVVLSAQAVWAEKGNKGHEEHEGHEGGHSAPASRPAPHPQAVHAAAPHSNSPKSHGPSFNHEGPNNNHHSADHSGPNPHSMAEGHNPSNHAMNHEASSDRPRPEAYNPKHFSTMHSSSAPLPNRYKTLGFHSAPRPMADHSYYVATSREHSRIVLPTRGPDGHDLKFHVVARTEIGSPLVQRHMASLGAGPEMAHINHYNAVETRPNYYYWHSYNGYRYCHYYDPWGYHWYGWYLGDTCFWTRYYWGNWWWYDGAQARWCYWHDGGWWWNDPYNTAVVYVYVNGDYQPIQTDGVSGSVEGSVGGGGEVSQVSDSSPSSLPQRANFPCPDQSRVVKIFGDSRDAFLSDTATPPSFHSVFLGSNAETVIYSQSGSGGWKITVTYGDGSVKHFTEDGQNLDGNHT